MNDSPTVAYTGFQIAYYMGFRKMYMIGFDQTYRAIKDENGNIVTNDKVKSDYFSDKYRNDETDNLIIPAVFEMNRAFLSVDYHIKTVILIWKFTMQLEAVHLRFFRGLI